MFRSAIADHGRESLQYTVSNGSPRLREQVAERMGRDGVRCTADDVLILQGGQQGLDLAAKLLIDKGDVIVTEDPTFLGALIAFNPCQPRYAAVPMDDDGMDMDALERDARAAPGREASLHRPRLPEPDRRHPAACRAASG